MKREIRFRAWNETDKLMSDPFGIKPGTLMWRSNNESGVTYASLFPEYEVMQFTGLKDKNGKDIFEGDIVSFLNGSITSTESGMDCDEFQTAGEIFWCSEDHGWDVTGRIDVDRLEAITDDLEIIGNIHQNPGLI